MTFCIINIDHSDMQILHLVHRFILMFGSLSSKRLYSFSFKFDNFTTSRLDVRRKTSLFITVKSWAGNLLCGYF